MIIKRPFAPRGRREAKWESVPGPSLPRNSPTRLGLSERVRSVLEGGTAVGEPRWTGGVGRRGVRGTDLPLSPGDTLRCRVVEALREAAHGCRGHHDP